MAEDLTNDESSVEAVRRDVADARARGDHMEEARALYKLSVILVGLKRFEEADAVRAQLEPFGHRVGSSNIVAFAQGRGPENWRHEARTLFDLELTEQARQFTRNQIERLNLERGEAEAAQAAARREGNRLEHLARIEAIRDKGAQTIAAARERGDRQAEATALVALSKGLRNCAGPPEEVGEAARQALALATQERSRRGLVEAGRALAAARELGDTVAEVLALLDRGRFSAALGQHAEAEAHLAQAVQLARTAASAECSGTERVRQRSLSSMAKALREAGLEEAALVVEEQSGPAQERPASITVSNQADRVHAHNFVQVGVVHGGLHLIAEPASRSETALNVSVTTSQVTSTTYEYEGRHASPDAKIHVFVEAFTAQAVLLRRLRPVFVREVASYGESNAMQMQPREFRVGLDRPAHHYDADVAGQGLRLDRAFAEGCDDFPFYVTASAPEYFVIWPELRGAGGPVEWRLELDWSCLGQHGTVAIDHGDRPFLSNGSLSRLDDWDRDRKGR
jgi:tetratricopeptide (TPR) repeat protein